MHRSLSTNLSRQLCGWKDIQKVKVRKLFTRLTPPSYHNWIGGLSDTRAIRNRHVWLPHQATKDDWNVRTDCLVQSRRSQYKTTRWDPTTTSSFLYPCLPAIDYGGLGERWRCVDVCLSSQLMNKPWPFFNSCSSASVATWKDYFHSSWLPKFVETHQSQV